MEQQTGLASAPAPTESSGMAVPRMRQAAHGACLDSIVLNKVGLPIYTPVPHIHLLRKKTGTSIKSFREVLGLASTF